MTGNQETSQQNLTDALLDSMCNRMIEHIHRHRPFEFDELYRFVNANLQVKSADLDTLSTLHETFRNCGITNVTHLKTFWHEFRDYRNESKARSEAEVKVHFCFLVGHYLLGRY